MLKVFTALCKHHAYMSIKNHTCKYRKSFILIGWIPAEYEGQIKAALDPIDSVEVTFTKFFGVTFANTLVSSMSSRVAANSSVSSVGL